MNTSFHVSPEILDKLGFAFVRESKGFVEYTLKSNGLKVILGENHGAPVVTVMPVYRVGSRNEAVGYTGATHILEHMMFKGVRNGRTGEVYSFPDLLKPLGAAWNATTWFDRTNYFETVPARHLELCIAAESDRMRNLLLKDEERASEMTVVRNELERGENSPDRVMMDQMYANAFREHPYHHPTIGWVSDVEGISMARLKQFYDDFYWPNNASLLIMGDFDSAETLALVAKYYGVIPASPAPIPAVYTVEREQEGEKFFIIRRAGDLPRVFLAYHVPQATHADSYALAAMDSVLSGFNASRSCRLYKALIKTKLASEVFSWHNRQRDPGLFMIGATVAAGQKIEDVQAALLAEIAKLASEPVSNDELARAKSANKKKTALASADPMQSANRLAEAESVADWFWGVNFDENFDAVTPADVKRVASTYFGEDNRTVGHFIPKSKDEAPAESPTPEAAEPVATTSGAAKATFASQTVRKVLANGLTVLAMRNPGAGVVGISGKLKAGGYFAPADKPLVAALTGELLSRGSKTMSAEKVAQTLEEMGANLGFHANNFTVNFGSQVVSSDLAGMLALTADLLINPSFPEDQLEEAKVMYGSYFTSQMDDTEAMAKSTLVRELYPESSVYHDRSFADCLTELAAITVDDLKAFHASAYTPKGSILTIVGDIDVDAAMAMVESAFGAWEGVEPKAIELPETVLAPALNKRVNVPLKDKANTSIIIGQPCALKRSAADFMAARFANAALGGDTISARLGKCIRKDHGLTYGVYCQYDDPTLGGALWAIELSVNPDNVEKAIELVNQVVAEYLEGGITDEELSAEANSAAGSFEVQLRRSDAIARTLTDFEFLGLGPEGMDNYADVAMGVTRDEVNAALRKYIRPESFVTVVCGSTK